MFDGNVRLHDLEKRWEASEEKEKKNNWKEKKKKKMYLGVKREKRVEIILLTRRFDARRHEIGENDRNKMKSGW